MVQTQWENIGQTEGGIRYLVFPVNRDKKIPNGEKIKDNNLLIKTYLKIGT